jgi:hypothetical protein
MCQLQWVLESSEFQLGRWFLFLFLGFSFVFNLNFIMFLILDELSVRSLRVCSPSNPDLHMSNIDIYVCT